MSESSAHLTTVPSTMPLLDIANAVTLQLVRLMMISLLLTPPKWPRKTNEDCKQTKQGLKDSRT
jgi:hypothetical protein